MRAGSTQSGPSTSGSTGHLKGAKDAHLVVPQRELWKHHDSEHKVV
jgi:hypothetical protein